MTIDKDVLMMLGRIDGKLDGISEHQKRQDGEIKALRGEVHTGNQRLDSKIDSNHAELDKRLREVEKKTVVIATVGSGAVSIGITLMAEGVRQWLRNGGNGGL